MGVFLDVSVVRLAALSEFFHADLRFKLSNHQLIRLLLIQSTTPSC